MENYYIHKCSCGEVLEKTPDAGVNWRRTYECRKCGRFWLIKAKLEFEKVELITKGV